jgi:DNA-binding NarL/FixJ family response regulator
MRILLVDDHALIRDALRAILAEIVADAAVDEAASARKAMELAESGPETQLVILDLGLPDGDGLQLLRTIRARCPGTAVVVLSSSTESEVMAAALDAGAVGFIPKSAPRSVMVGALGLVLAGGIYIPPEAWPSRQKDQPPTAPERPPTPAELGLTQRQLDVLALLMRGRSNKAIARTLSIAEVTVKHHVTALMRALQVSNRTEAALAIARYGWQLPDIA